MKKIQTAMTKTTIVLAVAAVFMPSLAQAAGTIYVMGSTDGNSTSYTATGVNSSVSGSVPGVIINTGGGVFNVQGGGTANFGTTSLSVSAGITADITGDVSGSAATVTGATQSAITSVGTLTSLRVSGGINNLSGGITNAGAISGGTTINATGLATLGSASITGNGSVGGTFGVTGATTVGGATQINNTLGVTGRITGTGGATITGATNINDSSNAVTNINTGTSAGAVMIGNASNTTSINSAINNIGVNAFATTNNIGNGAASSINSIGNNAAFASVNVIGSSNAGTTVNQFAGNSNMSLANGTASLISGGNGFTTTSASRVVGTDITLSNGTSASKALVNGANVVNLIKGNTLVDGNMYINGSLTYSSSTAATTTVTDSGRNTSGGMSVVNANQTGVGVDANGKLTTGVATTQATAALTVTNSLGNTHGIVVQEDKTTISGGTRSSSMTLDDRGATFSNAATGAPVQVHGVKDGTSDYDAVNVRQFSSAIASVTAMANIPQVDQDKSVAVGMAMGSFMGKTALAAGVTYRFTKNGVLKGTVSSALNGSQSAAVGIGAAWSY